MDQVRRLLTGLGIKYVDLAPKVFGLGVGIGYDAGFTVLSVFAGQTFVRFTGGVLMDVDQDRLAVLNACNKRTQDLPSFPVFLHDADAGWDVLTATQFPIGILVHAPAFLKDYVEAMAMVSTDARATFAELRVGGNPYEWSGEDLDRLLIRSLL